MRTTLMLKVIIAIALTGLSVSWAEGASSSLSTRGHTIIIVQKPDPQDAPRTPVNNPFFAELMDDYVLLGSSDSIGTVSVRITSTAGDDYSTWFNTADGAIVLPISGDSGYYTLRITTPGGIHYIGEFNL